MIYRNHEHRKVLAQPTFAHKSLPSLRILEILAAILFFSLVAGCMSDSTLTERVEPTSMGNCFPASVFTAEDMQARVDCHSDEYKLEITDDTVVLFAFPDPIMDWVGPIFVIHISSVSEAVLKTDGSVIFEEYKTPDGRQAIEGVLINQELLTSILERAEEIEKRRAP